MKVGKRLTCPDDCRLGIKWFEVVAQIVIDLYIFVTLRQYTHLPVKANASGFINATRTQAITAPVAEAFADHLELLIANDIHRTALRPWFGFARAVCRFQLIDRLHGDQMSFLARKAVPIRAEVARMPTIPPTCFP